MCSLINIEMMCKHMEKAIIRVNLTPSSSHQDMELKLGTEAPQAGTTCWPPQAYGHRGK